METIKIPLSNTKDFVYELINEGTEQQSWINERICDKDGNELISFTEEELKKLFNILY